jgi:hypothetical protein
VTTKSVVLEIDPLTPNSRSYLNRWIQPDSIIPDPNNPQSYDRYAYVLNNPLKYIDPNGHATCEEMPWECDSNGNWLDGDNILFPPTPPPDELLQPGYEWWLVTKDGVLTYYYTPSINSGEAGLSSNPNDWIGEPYKEAMMEGSVIINGELWKYDNGRFVKQGFCSNGGVPVGYGCLSDYAVTGATEDGRPIYSVDGAVAACPPGGGGTNACGTFGFNPAFQQGGPPLYVDVPGNEGYVLIVNPIDSGGRLGDTQIDIYAGINRSWPYLLNNPYAVWRQSPSNYISSHGAQ